MELELKMTNKYLEKIAEGLNYNVSAAEAGVNNSGMTHEQSSAAIMAHFKAHPEHLQQIMNAHRSAAGQPLLSSPVHVA